MTRRKLLWLAGAAVLVLAATTTSGRAGPDECPVPPDLLEVPVKLPHLAARLRDKEPVAVVAIGGGSTKGAAAGSADLAYPQRLQAALASFYPGVPITVKNEGVARQSTRQMVERFATDVFPEKPVLVVWETGISDAVRGIDPDEFAAALQTGIEEVKNRAIDIVLVDMQFSRRASTVIDFEHYLNMIHRVGELNEVYVFPRFALMRYWSEQNVFNFDDVAESERTKLAAKVYDCISRTLAEAIRSAAR
jgi:acyl-CoA thioesterase I